MNKEPATCLDNLYRDIGPNLLAYLRSGHADPQAAEDLLQETFFQAAQRPERLRIARSPKAWLFAIARRVAATAWRRRQTTDPLPSELVAPSPPTNPRLDAVRQAIVDLPPAYRETFELRVRDELTYAEIADVLDVPIGTVRSRLHAALQRIRAAVRGPT